MTMAKAVNSGLRRALADDDRVLLMGEDIGTLVTATVGAGEDR